MGISQGHLIDNKAQSNKCLQQSQQSCASDIGYTCKQQPPCRICSAFAQIPAVQIHDMHVLKLNNRACATFSFTPLDHGCAFAQASSLKLSVTTKDCRPSFWVIPKMCWLDSSCDTDHKQSVCSPGSQQRHRINERLCTTVAPEERISTRPKLLWSAWIISQIGFNNIAQARSSRWWEPA